MVAGCSKIYYYLFKHFLFLDNFSCFQILNILVHKSLSLSLTTSLGYSHRNGITRSKAAILFKTPNDQKSHYTLGNVLPFTPIIWVGESRTDQRSFQHYHSLLVGREFGHSTRLSLQSFMGCSASSLTVLSTRGMKGCYHKHRYGCTQ